MRSPMPAIPACVAADCCSASPSARAGELIGAPIVAIDHLGAGLHSKVFVSTDGIGCRNEVHDPKSPVRNFVQGIIDN